MFSTFRLQGFTCRTHGFDSRRCCAFASKVTLLPKQEYVVSVLRRKFPIHLPVNLADCYLDIVLGKVCQAELVGYEESQERLVEDTSHFFDETEEVRVFLSGLSESVLREYAARVRARTNVLALLGKPWKRSAQAELFGKHPLTYRCCSAGNMDRGFVYVTLEYKGYIRR